MREFFILVVNYIPDECLEYGTFFSLRKFRFPLKVQESLRDLVGLFRCQVVSAVVECCE
jgi:hypothetical protein